VELGDKVSAGQTLARVHDMERTGAEPVVYTAPIDGLFAARHFPGLINMGDIVTVIAVRT
jgi:N-alpha-acetyl-L-2,4-diaminobutyrate deacetylase